MNLKQPISRRTTAIVVGLLALVPGAAAGGYVGYERGKNYIPTDSAELREKANILRYEAASDTAKFEDRTRVSLGSLLADKRAGKTTTPLNVRFGVALIEELTEPHAPGDKTPSAIPGQPSFRIYLNPIVAAEELSDGSTRSAYAGIGKVYFGGAGEDTVHVRSSDWQLPEVYEGKGSTRSVADYGYDGTGFTANGQRFGVVVDFHPSNQDENADRVAAFEEAERLLSGMQLKQTA